MLGPEIEVIRDVMDDEMHNMPCPVFISSMVVHMTANKSLFWAVWTAGSCFQQDKRCKSLNSKDRTLYKLLYGWSVKFTIVETFIS